MSAQYHTATYEDWKVYSAFTLKRRVGAYLCSQPMNAKAVSAAQAKVAIARRTDGRRHALPSSRGLRWLGSSALAIGVIIARFG
jgi:hypothetical protein